MPAMLGVDADVPPPAMNVKLPCEVTHEPPCAAAQVK